MAIEVFFIEEMDKVITENESLDKWLDTVKELGLEGQLSLTSEGKTPIPFRKMTRVEREVYTQLCPEYENVKNYKSDAIPLRVLSLIALAEKENYFGRIDIWYATENTDPIAVGYKLRPDQKPNDVSRWNNDGIFLIARWGDELRSFPELQKMAKESYIRDEEERHQKALIEANKFGI
jgi:hypothetical protein